MPDITMCMNAECPVRKRCYRYVVRPSEDNQSYAMFKPKKENGDVSCDFFMSIER